MKLTALARRYAPNDGGKLLELGCGLGHLLGLLQDDYQCVGIDLIDYSVEQTKINAPKAEAYQMSADDLSMFEDGSFSAVIALHLVERFTRTDLNTLVYEVTIDDPRTYTRPWKARWTIPWVPDEEIQEYFCEEKVQ